MTFPHEFPASWISHGLKIDHTLDVLANGFGASKPGLISEADCTLELAIAFEDGSVLWNVESVTFWPYGTHSEMSVTPESDPVMWEIIRRSVMANFKKLDEEIRELALEDA